MNYTAETCYTKCIIIAVSIINDTNCNETYNVTI